MALAKSINASLVLIDDRVARKVAKDRGFKVLGVLGILRDASKAGLLDLNIALTRLQETNFRVSKQIVERLLADE